MIESGASSFILVEFCLVHVATLGSLWRRRCSEREVEPTNVENAAEMICMSRGTWRFHTAPRYPSQCHLVPRPAPAVQILAWLWRQFGSGALRSAASCSLVASAN